MGNEGVMPPSSQCARGTALEKLRAGVGGGCELWDSVLGGDGSSALALAW